MPIQLTKEASKTVFRIMVDENLDLECFVLRISTRINNQGIKELMIGFSRLEEVVFKEDIQDQYGIQVWNETKQDGVMDVINVDNRVGFTFKPQEE